MLLLPVALPGSASRAFAQGGQCASYPSVVWQEHVTRSFSILYPQAYAPIAEMLAARQAGQALDNEYARFVALFEVPNSGIVTIRVYPTVYDFACLNGVSGDLPAGLLHTHAGTREIALIGDRILNNFPAWAQNDINFIRYELAVLFTLQAGGENVPPGLLAAVGHYAQDPAQTVGLLRINRADWLEPEHSLRDLLQESRAHDLRARLEATSATAYLVDTYGWDAFLTFLRSLPGAQGFAQALERAYGEAYLTLEDGWKAYFPTYFQRRWQAHPFYNYDLSSIQAMINEEQYAEADEALQSAIAFLEMTDQPARLRNAQGLLVRARSGMEAQTLFSRSQEAYYSGDYQTALDLLGQAERKYAAAGSRLAHLDVLNGHRRQIQDVLALHTELDRFEDQAGARLLVHSRQLEALAARFSALGDARGYERVLALARLADNQDRTLLTLFSALVCAAALLLLALRIFWLRRAPPPEAQL